MFTLSVTPSTAFLTLRTSPSSLSSSASAAYSSSPSPSSQLYLVSLRWRSSACPCLFSTLKVTTIVKLVKNTESVSLLPIQCAERKEAVASMASHTPNLECQMYETRYSDVDMAVMI
ncbi:hypothetical protein ACFXTO_023175 [Malus domestica]